MYNKPKGSKDNVLKPGALQMFIEVIRVGLLVCHRNGMPIYMSSF